MLIAIITLAASLGSLALLLLIASAMSSQISREEEVKEVIYNKKLTFKNQIVVDAEFEECGRPVAAPPSSGIIRISDYRPRQVRQAAVGNGRSKISLYV